MFSTINLQNYFSKIADLGWVAIPIDLNFAQQLKSELKNKMNLDLFRPAGLAQALIEKQIRNDLICWIDENNPTPIESQLMTNMTTIMTALKNNFRIGLTHFEMHYAIFPKGHFYKKHNDQKNNHNHRFFSFVIYLNENWKIEYGGQLMISDKNDTAQIQINPEIGQMVLFRSDLWHEVALSQQERQSITGWMRTS